MNIEALQSEGLPIYPFLTTANSKRQAIDSLAMAIERHEITLLNDDVLKNELMAYTLEKLPSGTYRYSAPNGLHDDCVMSVAIAWQGVLSVIPENW